MVRFYPVSVVLQKKGFWQCFLVQNLKSPAFLSCGVRSVLRLRDDAMRFALFSLMLIFVAGCSSVPFDQTAFGVANTETGAPKTGDDEAVARLSKRELAAGKLPEGTYDKAPVGAFEHRDYRNVRLDPNEALKLINRYRASKGLSKVALDVTLTQVAKKHSRDLAKHDRISHYGSDGSNPWDRVERSGYAPQLAAENVGTGQLSIKEVMQGWKDSPGHNKNLLLPDAKHIGIALVYNAKTEYKTFWTLVLGSKI